MNKGAIVINTLATLDLPSDLYESLTKVVRDYNWKSTENVCFNCQGTGTSKYTLRICTACNGTGILPEHVKP